MLIGHFHIFFGRVLVQIFCVSHIFVKLLFSLLLSCKGSVYILNTFCTFWIHVLKYFLQSVDYFFIFLLLSLQKQFLFLIKSKLFPLQFVLFMDLSKNLCLIQEICFLFFTRIFRVLTYLHLDLQSISS